MSLPFGFNKTQAIVLVIAVVLAIKWARSASYKPLPFIG